MNNYSDTVIQDGIYEEQIPSMPYTMNPFVQNKVDE
jgi:hypothetical protein